MEERLKHRLVGAIVLVSLAVVIVPVLLDAPVDVYEEPITAPLPERPQGEFDASSSAAGGEPDTPRLDAEIERERGQSAPDEIVADSATASGAPPAAGSADPFPASRASGDSTANGTSAAAESAAGSNGWTVQLGSFQKSDNARSLRDRLLSRGYDAFVKAGASADGDVYRVFVGSALDREQARRSAERLQHEMELEGFVVRQKGG